MPKPNPPYLNIAPLSFFFFLLLVFYSLLDILSAVASGICASPIVLSNYVRDDELGTAEPADTHDGTELYSTDPLRVLGTPVIPGPRSLLRFDLLGAFSTHLVFGFNAIYPVIFIFFYFFEREQVFFYIDHCQTVVRLFDTKSSCNERLVNQICLRVSSVSFHSMCSPVAPA